MAVQSAPEPRREFTRSASLADPGEVSAENKGPHAEAAAVDVPVDVLRQMEQHRYKQG